MTCVALGVAIKQISVSNEPDVKNGGGIAHNIAESSVESKSK
jgi:hypothetical protein